AAQNHAAAAGRSRLGSITGTPRLATGPAVRGTLPGGGQRRRPNPRGIRRSIRKRWTDAETALWCAAPARVRGRRLAAEMPANGVDRGTKAIGAALTLAVAVTLFGYGGHALDDRLGTSPLFLIVGVALGLVGGFIHVVAALAPELLPFGRNRRHDDE